MSEAAPGLSAEQLGAYFALVEVSSLLQYAVDEHLRLEGDLSYVQFQLLARLVDAPGGTLRMTDLADGVVYSRSGLTYQAGLLDKRGLIVRSSSPDDERSVMVAVTEVGRDLVARVLPGHVDRVRQLLFEPLSGADVSALHSVLGVVRDHMRAAPPRSAKPRARRKRAG
ncbi:MarR family transcriptional regulator [Actinoplanes cyaneus]|uniref:MarR family transcriptional regulator n=1 Tax=Actinoplanes cyaneus TaxID=52696 RepID=A0A919IL24_9ACTN|nr:MarR family transcriptional regulator [Actinoplanes cyaneus]MCW2140976.1 DNA-binding transcriptional regulator, MarR family [Actinoplanes cyaneus]GID67036.1 MarR family transcriptional regulator [Actinoplanes cyaneus]